MTNPSPEALLQRRLQLAADVEEISSEVKLLAMNLAIVIARIQNGRTPLKGMDEDFTELISRVTSTTGQVSDILDAFKNEKTLLFSLPASSKIIEQRGAYDKIEASLNYVYQLSQQIIQSIKQLEDFKQVN